MAGISVNLDGAAVAALVVFSATNTGALVYFLGRVTETLKNHGGQIKGLRAGLFARNQKCEDCGRVVAVLASKEGVSL